MGDSPLEHHASTPAQLRERLAAERAGAAFLVVRDDAGHQHIHQLPEAGERPVTMGRGAGADLRIGWDPEVSRVHAQVACHAGAWFVEDDGLSANGTWVNGEPLRARRRLSDGDSIRVGHTAVAFRAPQHAEEEATMRAASEPPHVSAAQRRVLLALARPYGGGGGGGFATPATNQAIAEECVLTVDAVKAHLRALFERFGIAGLPQNAKRVRLVELAFLYGIVGERDFES